MGSSRERDWAAMDRNTMDLESEVRVSVNQRVSERAWHGNDDVLLGVEPAMFLFSQGLVSEELRAVGMVETLPVHVCCQGCFTDSQR